MYFSNCFFVYFVVCLSILLVVGQDNDLSQYSRDKEAFALEVFLTTALEAGENINLVISPFSIWVLLLLMYKGSNGNTASQLAETLRLSGDDRRIADIYRNTVNAIKISDSSIQQSQISAIFVDRQRPLKSNFVQSIENEYSTRVIPVDFSQYAPTVKYIDDFIANATRNRITNIVSYDDLIRAQMIVTNAAYFRGDWKFPFNASKTHDEPFFDEKGRSIGNVKMMYQRASFPYVNFNAQPKFRVTELPYGNDGKMSMLIVLPMPYESLTAVLRYIEKTGLRNIYDQIAKYRLDYEDEEVDLYLPKFKIASDFTMNVVLYEMGILDIFDPNSADLSRMSTDNNLFLSRVIHKAEIEVNEEGTIASGVTGGTVSYKTPSPKFQVNRPFAYFIIENSTKTIVFAGRISNATGLG